jgi:hypothetical protein
VFLPFLEEHFPHLVRRYRERFEKAAYLKGHYPEMIAERVERIRARHNLAPRREPEWPEPFAGDQLDLFPALTKGPAAAGSRRDSTLQRKVTRL